MAFANVPGPAFLTGFLLKHCFPDSGISGGALVATFLAVAVLLAQISRLLHPQKAATSLPLLVQEHSNTPFFEDLNAAIHQALAIQLQICGCLLFASALSALLSALLTHFFSMADGFFCGILTGIWQQWDSAVTLIRITNTGRSSARAGSVPNECTSWARITPMTVLWSALPKTVMLSGSQILHRNERCLEFIMSAVRGRKRTDTKACADYICITVIGWDFCPGNGNPIMHSCILFCGTIS